MSMEETGDHAVHRHDPRKLAAHDELVEDLLTNHQQGSFGIRSRQPIRLSNMHKQCGQLTVWHQS